MRARLVEYVPGLAAGVGGGVAGYLLVAYLMKTQGLWVPIVPGACAGLACGQVSAVASRGRGLLNALWVLGMVIYAQYKLFDPPFTFDGTLVDYARHLHQLPALTLGFVGVNAALGYWWGREQGIGFGRRRNPAHRAENL